MKMIAAVDNNWAIGRKGDLLFHIPDDMRRFRDLTKGNVVVMGRKTLQSLPGGKPLKDRENIVLTRDASLQIEGARVCTSLQELHAALQGAEYAGKEIYVIGGGEIFTLLLPYANEALITHVYADMEADAFFPKLSYLDEWELRDISGWMEYEGIAYAYATYINTCPRTAIL